MRSATMVLRDAAAIAVVIVAAAASVATSEAGYCTDEESCAQYCERSFVWDCEANSADASAECTQSVEERADDVTNNFADPLVCSCSALLEPSCSVTERRVSERSLVDSKCNVRSCQCTEQVIERCYRDDVEVPCP